ncbi:MAG: cytochrome c oxidase subunit II [Deltaproteobacteria bacterium]|nr:cytochrome c oxidase subunit II [Deltaproteobacteria bacterium]
MIGKFAFWPDLASSFAWKVDAIYILIILVTVLVSLGVYAAIVSFVIKYKRKSEDEIPEQIEGNLPLEILWSVIPLGLVLAMFGWGAVLFFELSTPPAEAINFSVVGKQWMWKVQHPSGKREINELHVPIGQPIRLTITSEDVLHSFYIPAFRAKMDAVPGRYTTSWFEPSKAGEYHIFCAEYCGTKHSMMIGRVVVMEPAQYEQWLKTGGATAVNTGETPEMAGARLFQEQRCMTCHQTNGIMAPVLQGLYGKEIELQGGQKVLFDEAYIRESILNPTAKITAGYQPVMPTFQGQVTEDAIMQLIAYIKSLAGAPGAHAATSPPTETKPVEPQATEGQAASPSTETPAVVTPPADDAQPNAGTDTPAAQPDEPQADGTDSSKEETM